MRSFVLACTTATALLACADAFAFPQILNDWQSRYGGVSSSGDNAGCQLCHGDSNGGSPWNTYGYDLIIARDELGCDTDGDNTVTNDESFACVEFFNSDDDTGENDNLSEILASTQPGWALGACNTLVSSVATTPGQDAPAGIGAIDPDGTAPLTGCDTDPTDPPDPGDATIVTVRAGESIQAAIDAVAPGSTVLIEAGVYREPGEGTNALNITKSGLRLIGLSDVAGDVVIEKSGEQRNGIVAVPASRTDCMSCHTTLAPPFTLAPGVASGGDTTPVILGLEIRNITIRGFINNGLFTERVDDFSIVNVHSVDNTNYGIFPTLSSNGLIQHSSATGADDSGIWVETSEYVRVTDNLVSGNVNGFEISNSDNIVVENNESHDNSVGISLFVLTDLVDEHPGANKVTVRNNWVYNNNKENTATPGSILSELPNGVGILLVGVDNSVIIDNLVEDNNSFGIVLADYCLGVQGTAFDCLDNPPPAEFDPVPERNSIIGNTLVNNGNNPEPSPFAPFAADITLFVPGDFGNCFLDNVLTTVIALTGTLRPCTPLGTPYLISGPTTPQPFDFLTPTLPYKNLGGSNPVTPVPVLRP